MAESSITFEGPDSTDPSKRSAARIAYSDETAMLTAVAFCTEYGYQPTVQVPNNSNGYDTVANPETPGMFTIRKILEYMQNVVKAYDVKQHTSSVPQVSQQELQKYNDTIRIEIVE